MKHCANDTCPDLRDFGLRGEYRDEVQVCPRCGATLVDGGTPTEDDLPKWRDLVPVASFTHVPSAHVARASLESAGIPAEVENEHLASMQWLYTSAIGGVRVLVSRDRAVEAREILATDHTDALELPDSDTESPDELCPRCQVGTGQPSKLDTRSRALSLLVGVPFVVWRRSLVCNRCGHTWRLHKEADA